MRALLAIVAALAACTGGSDAGGGSGGDDPVTCGAGTVLQGNECIAPVVTCGPGTHDDNGTCVADDRRFLIRAATRIAADGATPAAVSVFGRNADGTPAVDAIVLNTDRPGTGSFTPVTLTLDERGGLSSFVPCDAGTPGCTGPLQLTMALASAPTQPIAQFGVELVAPPHVGSIEHCLTGGNVLYVEGSGFVYKGAITIRDAAFNRQGGNMRGYVEVLPANPIQGAKWTFEISTVGLQMPLATGVYANAYQFPASGHAAINLTNTSPFAYCPYSYQGEFEVHDWQYSTQVDRMTVSFREWCGLSTKVIEGCVHIE